jgi:hypothetical protein
MVLGPCGQGASQGAFRTIALGWSRIPAQGFHPFKSSDEGGRMPPRFRPRRCRCVFGRILPARSSDRVGTPHKASILPLGASCEGIPFGGMLGMVAKDALGCPLRQYRHAGRGMRPFGEATADHASSDAGPLRSSALGRIISLVNIPSVKITRIRPRSALRVKGEGTGLGRDLGISGPRHGTSVLWQRNRLRPDAADRRCGIERGLRASYTVRPGTERTQRPRTQEERSTMRRRCPASSGAGQRSRNNGGGRQRPRTSLKTTVPCTGRNQHAVRPETTVLGQW